MKLLTSARLAMSTLFVFLFLTAAINAQTTAFTYQGRLTDAAMPANGTYEMQFRLFDTAGAGTGTQQGATVANPTVSVVNGIFTVQLDFGSAVFSTGANLFLEISLRPAGSTGGFTGLAPRQPITSAPYAIRALSAGQADLALDSNKLGGVNANQYVTGAVVKSINGLSNDVTLAAGSNITITPTGNTLTIASTANTGIQNQTTQQTGANFNIDGTGTANIFNAGTQYNIGGNRVLRARVDNNLFVGFNSGPSVTTGNSNSFVGANTGISNTTGSSNSFVGAYAGQSNTTSSGNSFFGAGAGFKNTTGSNNSFFGNSAGASNTTSANNSFFGDSAGLSNTTGGLNSFVGASAGYNNTTGANNAFFGANAGNRNTTSSNNSFFGYQAGFYNTTGVSNSFIGSNSGTANTTGYNNSFVGTNSGSANTTGSNNTFFGAIAGYSNTSGMGNIFIGTASGLSNATGNNNTILGNQADLANNLSYATAIGANATVFTSNTIVLGRYDGSDTVVIYGLGAAGSTQLCRNASNQISTCSSSLRYKTNIAPFAFGLNVVNQLRPISFDWKDGGMHDVGFGAEEVAKINPLFVTYNEKGEVEGVKYDRLSVAFVNAFKEQQAQIARQQTQIREQQTTNQNLQTQAERQQREIDALKKIVCAGNPSADVCGQEDK